MPGSLQALTVRLTSRTCPHRGPTQPSRPAPGPADSGGNEPPDVTGPPHNEVIGFHLNTLRDRLLVPPCAISADLIGRLVASVGTQGRAVTGDLFAAAHFALRMANVRFCVLKVVRCSAGCLYTALHGHSRSRGLRTLFTDFPHSVDMHTWTNQIADTLERSWGRSTTSISCQ